MLNLKKILLIALLVCCTGIGIQAQGRPDLSNVYVTTQDFVNLRNGPGFNWDVLTRLDFGVTMLATGRSFDSQWIQVVYDGDIEGESGDITYGWIAYWLLTWSGDILELPVDGVATIRSARRSGPLITIHPETRYYVDGIHPSTRVTDTVDEPTTVEVTGRIGSARAGYFWIQFELNGQYYWTASWEIGVPDGYFAVADGSSVYPYGRLVTQLQQVVTTNSRNWSIVAQRWRDLDAGYQTTCNNIPALTTIRESYFTEADLALEPGFTAAVTALESLIENINAATSLLGEVCNRVGSERYATAQEVRTALDYVEKAEQERNIVNLFLVPLERRNPLLGGRG